MRYLLFFLLEGSTEPTKKLIFGLQITTTLKNGEYLIFLRGNNIQINYLKTIAKSTFFGMELYLT